MTQNLPENTPSNLPKTMQAYAVDRYGANPVKLHELPLPEVGDFDVLVEIYAASVNPVDFKIRDGKLKLLLDYAMPLVLGNDYAGRVVAVGRKVSRFAVGDAVFGRPEKERMGTFAQYIASNENCVALMPKGLSFVEAASIPLVGLTAYQAFHELMHLKAGDKILIQAGAGGVGSFAIQLAKAMGASVATTVSQAGRALVEELGADHIIDYRTQNFAEVLHDYDFVFDTLAGKALTESFGILKKGGLAVSISAIPTARLAKEWHLPSWKGALFGLASAGLKFQAWRKGVRYEFLFMRPDGAQLAEIATLIEQGKIRPVIDRVFPFEQTQAALEYSEQGRAKGKIVVQIKAD